MTAAPITFTTTREIVDSFYSPYELRKNISAPRLMDGHVYATDGRWAVRAPAEAYGAPLPSVGDAGMSSNILRVFANAPWDCLQPLEPVTAELCSECEGSGWVHVERCGGCAGAPCDGCGTSPAAARAADARRCFDCEGLGLEPGNWIQRWNTRQDLMVQVAGVWFQRRLLAHLSRLPGIQLGVRQPELDAAGNVTLWTTAAFRWDGGEGVLMPCMPPHLTAAQCDEQMQAQYREQARRASELSQAEAKRSNAAHDAGAAMPQGGAA